MGERLHFSLTAFADEIDADLIFQTETLTRLGVRGLDLRSVWGINVLNLSELHMNTVRDACAASHIHIQCIGSPINKLDYDINHTRQENDRLKRSFEIAKFFDCKRVRLFTPAVPTAKSEELAPVIIDWMREQKRLAVDAGITLIVENDARYWSAYPENAKRLFGELGDENFRAVFDFANTVLIGYRPMQDWFPWLTPYLDTLHIKDAIESTGSVVPAGQGDGQLLETLTYLIREGWNGPLTLEPHLSDAGHLGGFSGIQRFEVAVNALRQVVTEAGASC